MLMHLFFSGIGGSGMSSMALLARQAGYEVSGSDSQESSTIEYLKKHGITDVHIGQTEALIEKVHRQKPIDWLVYTSAISDSDHPELAFCQKNNIKTTKRDDFLNFFIQEKGLKLVAVAGTHGKSTTTAMVIWLLSELGLPVSYNIGAKLNFGESGAYQPGSKYFVYEADEFDRNFLSFYPHMSLISGLDWDHPDIYSTRASYLEAFGEFIGQSEHSVLWRSDAEQLGLSADHSHLLLDDKDPAIDQATKLTGHVNRQNAWLVAQALAQLPQFPLTKNLEILNRFPGLSRRFERLAPNIYSDYAHTPPKIRGALQAAEELAGDNVVVVYEGLHNTRQHFIKDELAGLFDGVERLYIVPSYLAREDKKLKLLSPHDLLDLLSDKSRDHAEAAQLNNELARKINAHADSGQLVLALSAGGGSSLDEWLRKNFLKTV